MSNIVPVLKDEENQSLVPSAWRRTFSEIVEGLKLGDFNRVEQVVGVRQFSTEDGGRITANIEAYGAQLTSLPEDTWQTSVCQWMIGYWDVLVDLYTVEEGASDLVLAMRVYEKGSAFEFEILSVYVP